MVVRCSAEGNKFHLETVGKGYYEVIGTVQQDGTITEMTSAYFGENFDMGMHEQMVALSHQFPDIF